MLRSFLRRSGLWLGAKIIQACIIVFVFYIYAIILTREDYGNFQKVFVLVGFLSGFLCFGLPVYIAALPPDSLDDHLLNLIKKGKWIFITIILLLLAGIYTFFPQYRSPYVSIVFLLGLLNAFNLVYEVYALKKSGDSFVWKANFAFSVLYLLIHLLVLTDYQLIFLVTALSLAAIVRLTIFIGRYGFIGKSKQHSDALGGHAYFSQWIFISINEGLESFSKYLDKIVLIALLTATEFAIYFNGSYEIPLLGLLVAVAGTFTNLQITKYSLNNEQIRQLFYSTTSLVSTLVFPLFFFSCLYASSIFNVLFGNKYDEAVPFFLIYAWIIPLRIANYSAVLQAKMKSNLVTAGSLSALVLKLLLMVLLYRSSGVKGIALAVVIGTYYQVLFYIYHIARVLTIPIVKVLPFKKLAIVFLLAAGVNLGAYYAIRHLPSLQQLIFGGSVLAINAVAGFLILIKQEKDLSLLKEG
ncbi:MAG TPA: oligosaccharide flippase family protein [Chitinophagaceae bacterium]|nr:oligosaccharide flippase family protein [Chitinophagaceae bacterium]